jgi:predicted ATP-grasp superfamily ATP-dependent carboligase
MSSKQNVVYVVGGDHHNGLGLARIFGLNGVEVRSLVAGDCKKSFLRKSKYVSESLVFPTEKNAYDYLSKLPECDLKPFIIPYSDTSALELDKRLDEFKDRYYVPSINNTQGEIARLMDKQNQYAFAKSAGIRMAYTVTADIKAESHPELDRMPFPCIIKPVISAEGHKRDIAICKDRDELLSVVNKYKEHGYYRALVQEYLTIDYEIDVFGCTLKQKPFICQIPTHTIRSWLPKGGTNSFSRIITETKIVSGCKRIIEAVKNCGFYGLYDIELFVVHGEIILNEVNLRNSGDVYMGLAQKYYYPYAWYCDVLGEKIKILPNPTRADYTMTECADFRNVLTHHVGLSEWFRDYRKCKDYALRFKGDMGPALSRYAYYVKQFIKGKRL